MKCKTWSTKINNFVVRRLKYIKINNQQHLSTTTAAIAATTAVTTTVSTTAQLQQQITQAKAAAQPQAQQQLQQQQQYLATCSTMPAMSKDNTATAVSLNESNFSELKIKELSATAQQQNPLTTATATTATASTMATTSRLPQHNHNQMQQHRQQQNRSTCGCGESSYTEAENGIAGSTRNLTNGHTSPIAAAMAQNSPTAAASMQQRNIASRNCCRSQNSTRPPQLNGSNEAPQQNRSPNAAPSAAPPARRSPKDFIFGMSIGEGSFSNVYLGKDVQTKREYAIKVCEKRHIIREHKEEYIRREREVMHMLAGVPGFVNLSCTFQDERKLYFVMTYANNGDMLPWINKVGSFDVDCTRQYAAELVLACEQMHRRNIIHRDLKPDNILFDENMHTLIADFGSSKIMTPSERVDAEEALAADLVDGNSGATPSSNSSEGKSRLSARSTARSSDDDDNEEEDYETGSDEVDSPSSRRQPYRYQRRRRGSFVGTAQYVSPEVLQNSIITPSADLWALGCIIYQMISGLPPFRGSTEYVIFKEILACNLEFPEGFDPHAEDLVRKLLKIVPGQRLGAQDVNSCYTSIRSHPFFDGIDFDNLRSQAPPPINPNLPGVLNEPGFNPASRVFDNLDGLEPGLDAKQMSRILGWELGFGVSGGKNSYNAAGADVVDSVSTKKSNKTAGTNSFDLSVKEKTLRLQQQQSDKWHVFADNEVILKKGYINKRKGLFARKRMFLLTTGPRLIYIDPVQMIKKGEIPWSPELRVETKNFRFFLVVTPNRIYYLDDPTSCSPEWKEAIEKLHSLTYPELQQQNDTAASRIPATPSTATTSASTTTPSLPSQFSALSMAASGTTLTTPSSLLAGANTSTSPSAPHSKSHKPASN